jgi:hypothetical protein
VYDLGGGGVPGLKEERPGQPSEEYTDGLLDEALREHGRGLNAVSRLAVRAGYQGDPATGHLVWALFADTTPRRRPS